jgi:YhcH/YjgK/YiaL family protein
MKSNTIKFLPILLTMVISCNQNVSNNPENWTEKELGEWFSKGEWKSGWEVIPDESIDRKELAIQYFKNPERWEKAFQFLKNENLKELELGTYELDGQDLFVIVQEYVTKNENDSRFEVHKQYIDIQYVVSGEEKMGVLPLKNTTIDVPYSSTDDITFLRSDSNNYRLASPELFFIFFPEDAHRPGVKSDNNAKVRKIVIKIRINKNE